MTKRKKDTNGEPELKASEGAARGPDGRILKGSTGNPGGQSKEKRAFLDRLTTDDADEIYTAFMGLVRDGSETAILRAVEYLAGRPRAAKEDNDALKQSLTVVVQSLAEKAKR